MSEVYIRSQNKEKLYRLGGNYACVEYGEYEDIKKKRGGAEADKKRHVICISDGCLQSEETITLLAIENSKPHKDGLLFRICQYVEFKQRARRENEKL